jgi:hypothetical protein
MSVDKKTEMSGNSMRQIALNRLDAPQSKALARLAR